MFGLHWWTQSQSTPATTIARTRSWFGFGFTPEQLLTLTQHLQRLCQAHKPLKMSSSTSSTSAEDDARTTGDISVDVDTMVKIPHHHLGELETVLDSDDDYEVAGAMIDVEGFCYAEYRVEQYAHSVLDFSSQYGIDLSISYTAPNITGRPSKYPEYGDSPQTFAMVCCYSSMYGITCET